MRFEAVLYIVILTLGVCPFVFAIWIFHAKEQVRKDDAEIDEHEAEVEKDELAAPYPKAKQSYPKGEHHAD